MTNYDQMVVRQRQLMFYLLAFLVLGAGFTPYQRIFLGLLLGSIISFYNLWLLQRKIGIVADSAEKERPVKNVGSLTRLASAALAVVVALRFEEYFHIVAVIIGLMTSYLVIMIDFFMFKSKE